MPTIRRLSAAPRRCRPSPPAATRTVCPIRPIENVVDTVTVGLARRTRPITTPSGFSVSLGRRPHGPQTADFDFAYDIQGDARDGDERDPAAGGARHHLRQRGRARLHAARRRPSTPSTLAPEQRLHHRGSGRRRGGPASTSCAFARGLQHRRADYAKIEILGLEDNSVDVQGPGQQQLRIQGASSPASPTADRLVIDLKRLRQDPEGSRASLLRRGDPSLGRVGRCAARPRPPAARAAGAGRGAQGRAQRGQRRGRPAEARQASRPTS